MVLLSTTCPFGLTSPFLIMGPLSMIVSSDQMYLSQNEETKAHLETSAESHSSCIDEHVSVAAHSVAETETRWIPRREQPRL